MKRNYREEIELALAGGAPEFVPFTSYQGHVPAGCGEALAARGMSISASAPVWKETTPNVNLKIINEPGNVMRVIHQTPVGEVWKLQKQTDGGSWGILEFYVKKPEDYKVVEFIFKDRRIEPCYDEFLTAQAQMGERGVVRSGGGSSPLLELQLVWLGQELFCYDLADRPDDLMHLHDLLWKNQQQSMKIVADSPARYINYCGNVVPEMLGLDNVRRYVEPCWEAWAKCLHAAGKKIGSHLDGKNRLLLEFIRQAKLDYVEAFTPPPDCDVSVAQAREALPGTAIWTNFPSSVHLADADNIRRTTLDLLHQAGDRKGFLLGVTEDVPPDRAKESFNAILDGIQAYHDQM
jgi:hypothetical protein